MLAQYAVIFVSKRSGVDPAGYSAMAEEMSNLAAQQEGYVDAESVYDPVTKSGITVSYWKDLESIRKWKANLRHKEAQAGGRKTWYSAFKLHVAKVERSTNMSKL